MKFINWFINQYATPSLIIGSIVSAIITCLLLFCVLFNFKPYITLGSGKLFGFTNYAKGLKVKVHFIDPFPDTSISYQTSNGVTGRVYLSKNDPFQRKFSSNVIEQNIFSADTIITKYELTGNGLRPVSDISVKSLNSLEATAYVETDRYWYKLLFFLPTVLLMLTLSYVGWQSGMLLYYIQNGGIFEMINYKRLQNIGFSIIGFEVFCLILGLIARFSGHDWMVHLQFASGTPNFISPLNIRAEPDYGFEWYWFTGGCMFVVIAKAFRKGFNLQQEQDLTI